MLLYLKILAQDISHGLTLTLLKYPDPSSKQPSLLRSFFAQSGLEHRLQSLCQKHP